MKLRKLQLLKVVASLVLVVVAGLATILIRDALSVQKPENALPVMDVYYNGLEAGDRLPIEHIRRDKYTWKFSIFPVATGGGLDLQVWQEIPWGAVNPGSNIDLAFTFPPDEVHVWRADGKVVHEFYPVEGEELYAPLTAGYYTYRVEANWGKDRTVQYYFRIQVPW